MNAAVNWSACAAATKSLEVSRSYTGLFKAM